MTDNEIKYSDKKSVRYFEYIDEKSKKFWEIDLNECIVNVRFGKIGTAGQKQTKKMLTVADSTKYAEKLIAEKISKGYAYLPHAEVQKVEKESCSETTEKNNLQSQNFLKIETEIDKLIGENILREAIKVELGKLGSKAAKKFWKNRLIGPAQWPYLNFHARLNVLGLSSIVGPNDTISEQSNTLSSDALMRMAKDEDEEVRASAAEYPAVTKEILKILAKDEEWSVRWAVAENNLTDRETLEQIFNDANKYDSGVSIFDVIGVTLGVSANALTPQYILEKTAFSKYENIRYNTAKNPSTPGKVLDTLANDPEDIVRYGVAKNSATSAATLVRLSTDKRLYVRNEVAKHPSIPLNILEKFSKSSRGKTTAKVDDLELEINIRASVAKNTSASAELLNRLALDEDADVRFAVAKNSATPIKTLRQLADDKEWNVSFAAILNKMMPWSERLLLLKRINAEPDNILAEAVGENYSDDIIRELRVQLWWINLLDISKKFNPSKNNVLKKIDVAYPNLLVMYESDADVLNESPISSVLAQCLGCAADDDVLDVSWCRKFPARVVDLPETLQRLWISQPLHKQKKYINKNAVNILRSNEVQLQLKKTQELKRKIIHEILMMFPDVRSSTCEHSDASILLRQVELSSESFDLKFDIQSPDVVDRSASMLSGPFFTSKNYPVPESMYPIVQIDLRVASSIIGKPIGDGLFQLWYSSGDFEGFIRVLPRDEVDYADETNFSIDSVNHSEDFGNFPLPFSWDSDPFGNGVKVFLNYESTGLVAQRDYLASYFNAMKEKFSLSDGFVKLVEKFQSLTEDKSSAMVHLFGSFYPIQYSHAEIGKKCLFSIEDWGSSGSAQIFYEINEAGSVSFEFRESLR